LQALCILDGLTQLRVPTVLGALRDQSPGVRRHAVRLSEKFLAKTPDLGEAFLSLVKDPNAQVRLQLAYSLADWHDARAGRALAALALPYPEDAYLIAAVLSSVHASNIAEVLAGVFAGDTATNPPEQLVRQLLGLATAWNDGTSFLPVLRKATTAADGHFARWQWAALVGLL